MPTVDRLVVAGLPLLPVSPRTAAARIAAAAAGGYGGDVHLVNAYTIALADGDPALSQVLINASMNFADGRPVALLARWATGRMLEQVRGPSLFEGVFETGAQYGLRHFLLGSTPTTLALLEVALVARFPDAEIVGTLSPPFREPSATELCERDAMIVASGANIVWVGLGTPRQDFEAARLSNEIGLVAVAVGAAFDFAAGTKPEAPTWMRQLTLEWLYRLVHEPKRLWRRYLFGNARFLWALATKRDRPKMRGL